MDGQNRQMRDKSVYLSSIPTTNDIKLPLSRTYKKNYYSMRSSIFFSYLTAKYEVEGPR